MSLDYAREAMLLSASMQCAIDNIRRGFSPLSVSDSLKQALREHRERCESAIAAERDARAQSIHAPRAQTGD